MDRYMIIRRFLISLCAIILMLFVLEGIVRYFKLAPVLFDYKIFEPMQFVENPRICYKMKPFGICEGGLLNAEGFKDKEFIREKQNDLVRIVMLGDSITKGTGVPLGETFSDRLENLLNQKSKALSSPVHYEVMNFGVGGYNIVSEIETLKVYALPYKPDIVILNYFYNDNEEYSFNYWFFLNKNDITPAEKNLVYQYYLASNAFNIQRVLLRSQLYTFCLVRIYDLFAQRKEIGSVHTKYREDIIQEKFSELKELSSRYNFKVLICMHPSLDYDKVAPHPNYDSTARTAHALNLFCLDLRPAYRKQSSDPRVFLLDPSDTIHPNAEGHKLIAEIIRKVLEENSMIQY